MEYKVKADYSGNPREEHARKEVSPYNQLDLYVAVARLYVYSMFMAQLVQ